MSQAYIGENKKADPPIDQKWFDLFWKTTMEPLLQQIKEKQNAVRP